MTLVAAVLAGYVFIGGGNWGGASFVKGMWHFWMQEEGIFGKPLGVVCRRPAIVQLDARRERRHFGRADRALGCDDVHLDGSISGMHQPMREVPVCGEEERARGIPVEAPHGE